MKYLLFGIILCLLSACAFTNKTSENNQDTLIIRSESAIIKYEHPSVCGDCIYIKPEPGHGKCIHCGNITETGSYNYCTKCSMRNNTCAICLAPLDIAAYLNDLERSVNLKKKTPNQPPSYIYSIQTTPLEDPTYIESPIIRFPEFCSRHQSHIVTCDMSKCIYCGAPVSSGVYKLCVSCAISRQQCSICLGYLNN